MARRLALLVVAASSSLALATAGCRALIGSLDECTTDGDCASRGSSLVCQNSLCVAASLDPRCSVVGSSDGNAIRVGAILPMTIPDAGGPDPRGQYRAKAIELAFSQLNPPVRQGISGMPMQVTICDDSNDPNIGSALAQELVTAHVVAIISASTSDTLGEATVTVPARVLLISSSATSPEIATLTANDPTTGVRMVWRTATSDTFQGQVIAETLASPPGDGGAPPRTAVFELNQSYGQGLWNAFSSDYPADAAANFLYEQGGGGVPEALTGAAMFAPQVALTIAFPSDSVSIVNGAHTTPGLESVGWFFTDSSQSPSLLVGLDPPNALEGARGTGPGILPTSPAYKWFSPEFAQTYSEDPLDVSFTANSFDAAMLLAFAASWAVEQGHPIDGPSLAMGLGQVSADGGLVVPLDPPDINSAIAEFAAGRGINVIGASGDLNFDTTTGEAPGPIAIWQVVDGGFATLQYVSP